MSFKTWTEEHQTLWEFIKFNILSNVSTAACFIVTWIGTALTGGAGMVVVLLAEIASQVVNYFVQMKFVFKSTVDFSKSAPKFAVLAVGIILINSFVVPWVGTLLIGAGMDAGLVNNGIVPVTGTVLAVIISFPVLKFWITPDN